jgi:hypothetical protein
MERRTGRGARDVSQKGKQKVFFSEVHSKNRIDSKNKIDSENGIDSKNEIDSGNGLDCLLSRFLVHLEDRSIQVRRLDLGVREIEIFGEGGGRRSRRERS